MEALELFEQLAQQTHHKADVQALSSQLSEKVHSYILMKDGEKLKSQLSGSAYLANESHIVQLS